MSSDIPYSIASNAKEFLSGMAAEQASYYKDKSKAAKDINTFITNVDKDLRSVYDKYIPNVHVINVLSFTNILANRIQEASTKILDEGSDTTIAQNFGVSSSDEYIGLLNVITTSVSSFHKKLLADQDGIKNPLAELNDLSSRLFNRTRKIDNAVSARLLGVEFSSKIRKVFGNKAVLAAIDPKLGSSDTVYVFFSSSFDSIGAAIRNNIYSKVEEYIKDTLGTDTKSNFKLGTIVNAGHAAVVNDVQSFVNSPAFAQVIYGVGSGRSSRLSDVSTAAEVFKVESRLLENTITVDKNFFTANGGYAVLLSLGVTFTNIEDAQYNIERGSRYENATVRSFDISKNTELTTSMRKKLQDTLMRVVFRSNPALGRGSRSIADFAGDVVLGILAGKHTTPELESLVFKQSTIVEKIVSNISSKATTFNTPSIPVQPKIPLRTNTGQFYSLTSLQSLINNQLQDVISANMGDGNAKNVLNYRTGRFAASAQVERMSISREGMITAFYTYMKYPYQTFEPGFKQGGIASRDPKLLISKSIREIAANKVGNRLRAVLV